MTAKTDASGTAEIKVADRATKIKVRADGYPEHWRPSKWYVVDKDGNQVARQKARAGEKYVNVYLLSRNADE